MKAHPFRFAFVLSALAASSIAHAQSNPYFLGVTQDVTHDSYMQRYGGVGQDWISTTGVRAGIDQTFGRQQVVADANVNRSLYKRNSLLDNTNYGVNARLNWSTLERLSGLLAVQSSQSLYKNNLTAVTGGRNMLRNNSVTLQAQLGTVTVWSFDAGVSASRQRISSGVPTLQSLNNDQHALSLGARWSPSPDLSVRLGGRRTEGKQPSLNDEFSRNDADLSTNVTLTGASTVFARISATRVNHTAPGIADQKGWTGLLGWNWTPTGKVRVGLSATRDSNLGSVDQLGVPVPFTQTTNSLSNSVSLNADWELTSKVSLNSRVSYLHRTVDYVTTTGKDSVTTASVGARYAPVRNVDLGCGFTLDKHDANTGVASPDYNARIVSCYGQLYLR